MRMTGWFDILSLDKLKMQEDKAGLEDALRSTVVLASHICQLYPRLMCKTLMKVSAINHLFSCLHEKHTSLADKFMSGSVPSGI